MTDDVSRRTFKKKKHNRKVIFQQGRVTLDADLNEQVDIQVYHDRTALNDIIGSGVPIAAAGFEIKIGENNGGYSYKIGKGRYYVDGILCENEKRVDAHNQPDLKPFPSFGSTSSTENIDYDIPLDEGRYIAYLDVWERHLTALDDLEIKEPALLGPDTTTRAKIIWQVKLLKLKESESSNEDLCMSSFLKNKTSLPVGTLQVRLSGSGSDTNGRGSYSGPGNHLYRIEIHKGTISADDQNLSFKWSRDNATPETKVMDIDNKHNTLTVSNTAKDIYRGFHKDQWVEVTDDRFELWGLHGMMIKLIDAKPSDQGYLLIFDPESNIDSQSLSNDNFKQIHNPKVRKWEGYIDGTASESVKAITDSEGYIQLEYGIGVKFTYENHDQKDGYYQTNDFWLFPARTVTGDIEWPKDGKGDPRKLPPVNNDPDINPKHHYSPLAILENKFDREVQQNQEESSISWFSLMEDKDEERGKLVTFLKQFDVSWDYGSSTVKKVKGNTVLQISDSNNNSYYLDKRDDKIFLTTTHGRLIYAFGFDDSSQVLLSPKLSLIADCRQFFPPITLTPTTGIAILPLNSIKEKAHLFGPFRHYLKVNVSPAIMLGLDSEEAPTEGIHFMEDYLRPDPSLYFKATFVDKTHFCISLEGSDLRTVGEYLKRDLKLRWWAVPAQDKGEQTGIAFHEKNHTDRKMREWFASIKSDISTLTSGISDRF